jgi:hypothetical protein
MSDDRDETRPFAPSGDAPGPNDAKPPAETRAGNTRPSDNDTDDSTQLPDALTDDATQADHAGSSETRRGLTDATQADIPRFDDDRPGVTDATRADIPRFDDDRPGLTDATQAGIPKFDEDPPGTTPVGIPAADDSTRVDAAARGAGVDETVAEPGLVPPVRGDAAVRRPRPDPTSVMPAADDWAPGRGNAAWTGRAEVRAPRPGGAGYPPSDEWAAPVVREPRDRWWMPIVVGVIALVLLAALGFGIWLIAQNSGGEGSPAPVASTPATPARTTTATTPPTTVPTTEPSPEPSTTEPTATEVQIPALVGLSLPDAQAALARTGLSSYKLIYRDNDAPPGTVIGSDPAEGQEVPPDTTVTLVVARQSTAAPTTATTTTPGSTEEPDGTGGD